MQIDSTADFYLLDNVKPITLRITGQADQIIPQSLNEPAEWLDPDAELTDLLELLKPYPSDQTEYHPVSRAVNSPQHNAPDCIVPP